MAAEWIWLGFITALGACVGSFLNVVIYRLPREKSLAWPGSACPSCKTLIRSYDNIPLVSWLLLRGRCRQCKTTISVRYFVIELVTALLFAGVYLWIFHYQGRQTGLEGVTAMQLFFSGGWLFYLAVITLMAAFLAASAIDLELWIIPIQLCWFVAVVGVAASTAAGWLMDANLAAYQLFPSATPKTAALALGAAVGTAISLLALHFGLIPQSYAMSEEFNPDKPETSFENEPKYNDRKEILKEIIFLLPVILCAIAALKLSQQASIQEKWLTFVAYPAATYGFGALAGYFVGCAVVWATRILGTLAFGREAMGLGDVHLMGAAGAVIGSGWVVLAFFVAPFFGILWALYQAIFKKIRQIPYGPFLSAAVFVVIIFHDSIRKLITTVYGF